METKTINKRLLSLYSVIGSENKANAVYDSVGFYKDCYDVLLEAKACYDGLSEARKSRIRNRRYVFADNLGQWSDTMEGTNITEAEHISNQGKTPLQFNIILSMVQTIMGQFRTNQTEPVCTARDRKEQSLGEMMSVALQYVYQFNEKWELDGNNLLEALISGVCTSKTTYSWIPEMQQCETKCENVPLPRMFFDLADDIRGWDHRILGQIHDLSKADLVATFAGGSKARAEKIIELYDHMTPDFIANTYGNMTTRRTDYLNFFTPDITGKCRVIEVWKLESMEKYWCHDTLEGKSFWLPFTPEAEGQIKYVNSMRITEAARYGAAPRLIEYKWDVHRFWYYRFFAPTGEILKEGESPYMHGSHPYTISKFLVMDGKPHAFVDSAIDPQRMMNRNFTLMDFIIGASAKGTLMIAEGTMPEGVKPEDWATEYRTIGGVLVYRPNPALPNGGAPAEISSNARVAGVSEMIALMKNLFPEMTGVHGALQGQEAQSGTSGRLYQAQAAQSAVNLVDTFETYKSHRTRTDRKMMKVTQQFWREARYIDIAGKRFSEEAKWYNPDKIMDADIDLSLSESTSTPNYQQITTEVLFRLYEAQAISAKNLLMNGSVPNADRILQTMEAEEKQAAQIQAQNPQLPQGKVTPDMVPQ